MVPHGDRVYQVMHPTFVMTYLSLLGVNKATRIYLPGNKAVNTANTRLLSLQINQVMKYRLQTGC